jgi:aminopeptidase N
MKQFVIVLMIFWSGISLSSTNLTDLTQEEALNRRSQILSVRYDIHLIFAKEERKFRGKTLLSLKLADLSKDLLIDFMGTIRKMEINGQEFSNYTFNNGKIIIPKASLTTPLKIQISFDNNFQSNAYGLFYFLDPVDQSEYIYTNLEPFGAHLIFPCFDQPDLKAIFKLSVTAPKNWKVIGNEIVDSKVQQKENLHWHFRPTSPISTYLFAVGAGDYVQWSSEHKGLPLELYARKALAEFVDAKELFRITQEAIDGFSKYYDYPFPYSKYVHLFAPQLLSAAMENPGMVTINERFIFRSLPSVAFQNERIRLILHEASHMWFGNLVTMRWWDDLWLNEAFATYTASLMHVMKLGSEQNWIEFLTLKHWGLITDLRPNTHPVEMPTKTANEATVNFDGITYGKGASVLKQLHFFVGNATFQKGIQQYFKKFAFRNATRKDFIDTIANVGKIDLDDWTAKWLQTRGLNKVDLSYHCKDGKIKTFNIFSQKSVDGFILPHRMKVSSYRSNKDDFKLIKSVDVFYDKETVPLKEMIGTECPDFVLPNAGDFDYADFTPDDESLKKAGKALKFLPDPLSRGQLWLMLGQLLTDLNLEPLNFMNYGIEAFEKEDNDILLGILTSRISSFRIQYSHFITPAERATLAPKFEKILWSRFDREYDPSSFAKITFFDYLVGIAQTAESSSRLLKMLKDPKSVNFSLPAQRRWKILRHLSLNGHPEALSLIEKELKTDKSDEAMRQALLARYDFPDLKSKENFWQDLFSYKIPINYLKEEFSLGYNINRPDLFYPFAERLFDFYQSIDWNLNLKFTEIYFQQVFPRSVCSEEVLLLSRQKLAQAKIPDLVRNRWDAANKEMELCLRIRSRGSFRL